MDNKNKKTGQQLLDELGAGLPISFTESKTAAIATNSRRSHIQFDRNKHLTFGEWDPQIKYAPRTKKEKELATAVKYGQLKLFLSELQFLNLYFNPSIHKNAVCLYIGAALGTHIAPLARMYPMIQFKLYDPAEFNMDVLKDIDNIEIFNNLFEEKDTIYRIVPGFSSSNS